MNGQNRTGQERTITVEDRAGYERTEQNRTGKDRTVEDRAGYERTEQTGQLRTEQ